MKALVTGASSGIGRDIAIYLSELGYDLIVVARREERLLELKNMLKTNVRVIKKDLSKRENIYELYDEVKDEDIHILINNAGLGVVGNFADTDMEKELNMIDVNVIAMHMLMKLILKDMIKKDNGYILNVSSMAGFISGPLMAGYYATKAYILNLTRSVYKELGINKSNVKLSVLCPGPVNTEFNEVAGVKFSVKPLSSKYVAEYAVNKMFKNRLVIIPGVGNKFGHVLGKILPNRWVSSFTYRIQKAKL